MGTLNEDTNNYSYQNLVELFLILITIFMGFDVLVCILVAYLFYKHRDMIDTFGVIMYGSLILYILYFIGLFKIFLLIIIGSIAFRRNTIKNKLSELWNHQIPKWRNVWNEKITNARKNDNNMTKITLKVYDYIVKLITELSNKLQLWFSTENINNIKTKIESYQIEGKVSYVNDKFGLLVKYLSVQLSKIIYIKPGIDTIKSTRQRIIDMFNQLDQLISMFNSPLFSMFTATPMIPTVTESPNTSNQNQAVTPSFDEVAQIGGLLESLLGNMTGKKSKNKNKKNDPFGDMMQSMMFGGGNNPMLALLNEMSDTSSSPRVVQEPKKEESKVEVPKYEELSNEETEKILDDLMKDIEKEDLEDTKSDTKQEDNKVVNRKSKKNKKK